MATSINISLPGPLKTYVDAQIDAGDYGTPGQYITELIQDDRDRRRRNLEEHVLDALKDESKSIEISDLAWANGEVVQTLKAHAKSLR